MPLAVTDDLVFVSETDQSESSLRALDAATGEEWWRREGPAGFWSVELIDGALYTLQDGIEARALDPGTGEHHWTRDVAAGLDPGGIYGRSAEGVLLGRSWRRSPPDTVVLDAATGETVWTRPGSGVVTTTDDLVVVAAEDGNVQAVGASGETVWQDGMTMVPRVKPSFADEYVYRPLSNVAIDGAVAMSFEGTNSVDVWAVEGSHHDTASLDAAVAPLFGCEETIVAGGEDRLFAFRVAGEP